MFSINTSIGRVPSLHHWGLGMVTLPNLCSSGHANILPAFILSISTGSSSNELTPDALSSSVASLSQVAVPQRLWKISIIKTTSDVLGTLCIVTSSSVRRAAGINLRILFLLGTGWATQIRGFQPCTISLDIRGNKN